MYQVLPFQRQLATEYRMIRRKLWDPPRLIAPPPPPDPCTWVKPEAVEIVPWSTPMVFQTHYRSGRGDRWRPVPDEEGVARRTAKWVRTNGQPICVRTVIKGVAQASGYSVRELVGPRRMKPMTSYRMIGMAMAKQITGKSFPEVARRFGNRDHTTAMNAYRKYGDLVRLVLSE